MSINNFINQIKKTVYSEEAGEAIANPSETNDIELTADTADTGAGNNNTEIFTKDEVKEILKINRNVNQLTSNTTKTFAILGDSVSAFPGYMPENPNYDPENPKEPKYYQSWYLEKNQGQGGNYPVKTVNDMWWAQVVDQANLTMICNSSWSGTCISTKLGTGHSFADRVANDFGEHRANTSSPDFLFILGGANDREKNADLGADNLVKAINDVNTSTEGWTNLTEINETTSETMINHILNGIPSDAKPVPYTYWRADDNRVNMLNKTLPAFCYLIDYLKKYNPNTKIYNIIINKVLRNNVPEGMLSICRIFGIKSIEITDFPGGNNDRLYLNGGHPTTEGQRLIADKVLSALKSDVHY